MPTQQTVLYSNAFIFLTNLFTLMIWAWAVFRNPKIIEFWLCLLAFPTFLLMDALNYYAYLPPQTMFKYVQPTLFFILYKIGLITTLFGNLLILIAAVFISKRIIRLNGH